MVAKRGILLGELRNPSWEGKPNHSFAYCCPRLEEFLVLKILEASVISSIAVFTWVCSVNSLGYLQRTCLSTPRFANSNRQGTRRGHPQSLKAPALLVLIITTPWIRPMLDQNRPGVTIYWCWKPGQHMSSSSKNSLLLFHTRAFNYTLCFECCCSRFCFGNSRNRSQNFEFWLNAIQNLSFIICGSFIVFELSCYSILSKDW